MFVPLVLAAPACAALTGIDSLTYLPADEAGGDAGTDASSDVAARDVTQSIDAPSIEAAAEAGASALLLGDLDLEPIEDQLKSGVAVAYKYKAVVTGTVGTVSLFLTPNSQASSVTVGIYDDDGGVPWNLLTDTQLPPPSAGLWNTSQLQSQPVLVAGEAYWIAVLTRKNTGAAHVLDRSGADGGRTPAVTHAVVDISDLPSQWKVGATTLDGPMSAHVDRIP